MTPPIRTRPDGTKYPISGGGRSRGAAGLVAVLAAGVLGGGALGAGAVGAAGTAAVGGVLDVLPGNLAGDVGDSLPGRDLATRRAEARKSARRGRTAETWSRLGLKQLVRRVEHAAGRELDCVAASTGQVRAFLIRTPCLSLDRLLLAVGDGHGNAAVVSVVRVGFRTAAQANAFEKIEAVPGSGDVRPLDIAAVLKLTHVTLTGNHYHSRPDGTAMIVAEADTATGHIDGPVLDAIADAASYLPVT